MNKNNPLEEISRKIDALDKNEVDGIIARGELLQRAKDLLRTHGGWLQWLKTRHAMPERTAQRYMKAARFAKNATVADFSACKLTANALYLLAEDNFWKKAGIGENGRRAATEEVLKAAAEKSEKVGAALAKEIINKTLGKSEPPEPAPLGNLLLPVFDDAVAKLKRLARKPLDNFAGTTHTADDLQRVTTFLCDVAKVPRREEAA